MPTIAMTKLKSKTRSLPLLKADLQQCCDDPTASLSSSSIRALIKYVQPFHLDTKCSKMLDTFIHDSMLYVIPIVDEYNVPVGIVVRSKVLELFTRLYTRELYGRKPILKLLDTGIVDTSPIVIEQEKELDDVARIIAHADHQCIADGFIITCKGFYIGMGSGRDLLNAITEQKNAHLYQLAHFDALTGLPSRLLFKDRLTQACNRILRKNAELKRPTAFLALMFMDLDRFKLVNDSFGHHAGDLLLKEVAQRLISCVRAEDTVSRLGGDEFTLILPQMKSTQDIANVAHKIITSIGEKFYILEHEVFVGISIGIALFPIDDNNVDELIKKADSALYHAKDNGRNNYQFFTKELNLVISKRINLERDLRYALESNEFFLCFQPLVNMHTGCIDGVEALIRWKRNGNDVYPGDFIPFAEETGLITSIGEWVLRTACKQGAVWQSAGLPPIQIAVNVSARQLRQPSFVNTVAEILQASGFNPQRLEFELTETLLMKNVDESIIVLEQLKALGIKLSIDDFGTGYSSLNYLQLLPVDILKMDRSFVQGINKDGNNPNIIRAIIGLAHGLGLHLTAEGVETQEQLDFLYQQNCDRMQGYLFSRPVIATILESMLIQGKCLHLIGHNHSNQMVAE